MQKILLLLVYLVAVDVANAQHSTSCNLDRLFNIQAGTSKQAVSDSVKNMYGLAPLEQDTQNAIAGIPENNGRKEQLTFFLNDAGCIKSNNTKIRFEFSNGILTAAYIQAGFLRADYYDMMDNFNMLRNQLKIIYPHEKESKAANDKLISTGYDFSTKRSAAGKIILRYIHTKPDDGYGIYLLQLVWLNTGNTGLETITY